VGGVGRQSSNVKGYHGCQIAFPEFNLEDKVSSKWKGNVTNIVVERTIADNSGIMENSHMINNERKRCNVRPKITNSKFADFEWFKY